MGLEHLLYMLCRWACFGYCGWCGAWSILGKQTKMKWEIEDEKTNIAYLHGWHIKREKRGKGFHYTCVCGNGGRVLTTSWRVVKETILLSLNLKLF